MQSIKASSTPSSAAVVSTCLACGCFLLTEGYGYFDTRFGHGGNYAIARCSSCDLEQTLPRPDTTELRRLYETYYNFGGEKATRYTRTRQRFLQSFLYRLWLRVDGDISFHSRKGTGRLLDIGCNEGRGLKLYRGNGYQAEGLEFNKQAAAVAQSAGFVVHTDHLSNFSAKVPYDRIVLSNVLEHALDPHQMLQDVRRLLADEGEAWISCPNSNSWLRTLFGRFWINWHVPFHITHFSRATLRRYVEEAGFDVRDMRMETPSLWVTQSLLARLYARHGQPTKELRSVVQVLPILLVVRCFLFPILWIGNMLGRGDCLVLSGRKRQVE